MSRWSDGADALEHLFTQHGAASFDKQVYLHAQFGRVGWAFDLNSGILAFRRPHEPPLQLHTQVLGTESEQTRTWLWSWANTQSNIPAALLDVAHRMRRLGEAAHNSDLVQPEMPLSARINGERLSMIAVGVSRAAAYFRAPYPGGAMFLIIKDGRYPRRVTRPVRRIARLFPAFLERYTITSVRAALLAYLRFYRLRIFETDTHLIGEHTAFDTITGVEHVERVTATFEGHRLVNWEHTAG